MVDKIKPLKLESPTGGGTESDTFPTEVDPTEDFLSAKGVAFDGGETVHIWSSNNEIRFKDSLVSDRPLKALINAKLLTFTNSVTSATSTFSTHMTFPFHGVNSGSQVKSIVGVGMVGSGVTGEARIFDVTNNQVIATGTFNSVTKTIFNFSAPANMSTGAAVWELQLRRSAGSGSTVASLFCLELRY